MEILKEFNIHELLRLLSKSEDDWQHAQDLPVPRIKYRQIYGNSF